MPRVNPDAHPIDRTLKDAEHSYRLAAVHLWPVVTANETKHFLSHPNRQGIRRISVDRIGNDFTASQTDNHSLLLLMPIADQQMAVSIADASKFIDVTTTVDHYAQLEILQQSAAKRHTHLKVLVAINSGANFFGCRAGTEARQLTLACCQQPNLVFAGLTSEVPAERTTNDISLEDAAIGALLGTAFKLQSRDIKCDFMHLRTHTHVSPSRIPTGWHVSPPLQAVSEFDFSSIPTAHKVDDSNQQHFKATVVARPCLQFAVIDCGKDVIQQASEIVLASDSRISVWQMDRTRCVLDMSTTKTELKIGQPICFTTGS